MWGSPSPDLLAPEENVWRSHHAGGQQLFWPVFLQLTGDNRAGIASSLAVEGAGLRVLGDNTAFVSSLSPSSRATCSTAPHWAGAAWGGSATSPWLPGKMLRWGTSAAWVTLTLPCSPRLAQLTPNALGTFIRSTGLSGTIGLQEILPSLSSLCQHELLEALSTPKEHLILRWIKPY